mgnify:CR=1 FL=1
MRQSCAEPIEILPDGTIPEVQMTSTGAGKPLDPYLSIGSDPVAARACYLTGHIRIGENKALEEIRDNDTAAWRDFDFNDGARKMVISVRPQAGGEILVYSEYLYGAPLATFKVPQGDGKTLITLEMEVNGELSGTRPIQMRFQGEKDKNLFEINGFRFE